MKLILSCNGRKKPLGVDRNHIRLAFDVAEEEKTLSYVFRVASSQDSLANGVFDVGVFPEESMGNHGVWISPELLKERRRYYWQVEAKTADRKVISEPAWFETGIDNWTAEWICGWTEETNSNQGAVQNFRKTFQITGKLTQARLYVCGLGYFDARLNEEKLDDIRYKPPVTDYAPRSHPENRCLYTSSGHRVTYYTYDVLRYLKKGENILDVDVADGYFYNVEKVEYAYNFSFGTPRLIYELHLTEDGIERVIRSDRSTLVCERNYSSKLYHGDVIDDTAEDTPYRESIPIHESMGTMVAPQCQEDKVCKKYEPISEREMDGGILYDFGVNHTGGLTFLAEAKDDGAVIEICYAEVLDENGYPNYETSAYDERSPEDGREPGTHQQSRYILRKGKTEVKPLYSWKCYRYAWIRTTGDIQISKLQSLFIHMDMEQNGHFSCSDDTLNQINDMFIQTVYCNLHSGLLTDCPHREKRPYTGDGNQIMKSIFYNMDAIPFFYKWLDDISDAQTPDGKIPNTVPNFGGGGGYAWGNVICTLTKELYHYTGDKRVVEKGYEILIGWLDYYQMNRDSDYIIRSNGAEWLLGDWLATDTVVSNVYYINTACYYIAADTAEYLATILGDKQVDKWKQLKKDIADGINRIFFDEEQLKYGHGVQGEDVLALAIGIVPEAYRKPMQEKVQKHYTEGTDYHFDTGIVLTPVLIQYLTDHGFPDIAYRMMTAKTYPSYYTLMEKETTFSEHWSKQWPDFYVGEVGNSRLIKGGRDLSHCHPMYGSVVSWLYERVAGLSLDMLYQKKVGITPYFTGHLTWAKAQKETPYGRTSVEWEHTESGLRLRVKIPENLIGICHLPSGYKEMKCRALGELLKADERGYFHFTIPSGEWIYETK